MVTIKEHCTAVKIVGFNNHYSSAGRLKTPMTISCVVDKKAVTLKTSGHMYLHEIIDGIVKRAKP